MTGITMLSFRLILLTFTISFVALEAHGRKRMVCYFGSWAVYRPGEGKFDVENIDPFLCTHLIYGFTGLRQGKIASLDSWNEKCEDYGKGAYVRFVKLKEENPDLKTMVAIGGWNEGSEKYSDMAKTSDGRRRFIESVVSFLEQFKFDGLDLDWEYPAHRGGHPEDRENFVHLTRELREEFDKHGKGKYLLTAAVSAGEDTIKNAYNVPEISKHLDFINVMAYDFHGGWEMFTGHHAPLYGNAMDKAHNFEKWNANHSIKYWLASGAPKEKLNLGMGTYGRGFTLNKESENGLYAPANQPLRPGPYTREAGSWGYNEICDFMKKEQGWTVVREPDYKAPYAYKGRDWIGYDDIESIKLKSEYARDMGLGGGMVWSLETDDFQGHCHGENYPLIKTMYRTIVGEYKHTPRPTKPPRSTADEVCRGTTPAPSTAGTTQSPMQSTTVAGQPSPSQRPTTENPGTGSDSDCPNEGIHEDKSDCTMFIWCVRQSDGTYMKIHQKCAAGTAYNPQTHTCTHPADVPGCNVKTVTHLKQGHF